MIQIQAVNGIGTGPNAAADFEGTTGLYPSAPTSVTAVPKAPDGVYTGTGTMLTVTWSTVTQTNGTGVVASYTVGVLDTDNAQAGWTETTVADPTDTMADVTVTNERTYLVRVRAVASTAALGSNGYLRGTVTAADVPAAPANVLAVIDSNTSSTVNVTWDSVPEMELDDTDITGYVVTWTNTTNPITGSRGSAAISGAGSGEYTISGLNPGEYTVSVVAVNHVGNSTPGRPTGTVGEADGQPVVPVPE